MKTFADYSELLPRALDWLRSVEQHSLANGRALTTEEIQDALSVGVQHPKNIRVLMVPSVTRPDHPDLLQAATEIGMLGENASARAIGYGIEVADGHSDRRLLRHEFRHVYQFEQAGSLELFIIDYIKSVLASGYYDSVFERDARAYEMP